ncbi:DNA topoisomerase 2-binding protein 1-A isoform X3 [Pistacia vera]|uniref:DNA topoisomerase 2-binding protein 1-A isoform X3 n=1 Tax=Pistacia vera TaxID=55513 RepID=UPI0012631CC9|nr:DNA topoisomerase 2-binding protein 1-A isoform X3 [Pistacia vera]
MLKPKPFKGASVFMSRNLVAPEIFDALLDALKLNGAEVFLCSDPSRTGPNDFHVISSSDHEKFEDLRAKGCNLLGPQCVLSCAKENRSFPKQGFTCCLAMDGVKVLASGFDMDEKVKVEKLVTAMGGVLQTKASLDVNFVIVKNVLAAKYKWALNTLKKPIVTINWLSQCWNEHRVVPQESYRVLPFSGLMICVTRIPADKRKEIEKLIIQNGGKYSPELTKKCTHLICDAPEGDKYKVAQRWGHIHIVNRKWFDQSVARRACLNEESYTVQGGSVSSKKSVKSCFTGQCKEDKVIGNSLPSLSSVATDSNFFSVPCTRFEDQDLEATLSQHTSSIFGDASISKEVESKAPTAQTKTESNPDNCVANDSQSEDNDLYLSECRILLVGFEACEMRKLVNMVRRGGGSRFVSGNNRLTHVIVGSLSEVEKREVRSLAALGVIQVVKTSWLEDCDRERKEIPVLQKHVAYHLLLPKDSVWSTKGAQICTNNLNQGQESSVLQSTPPVEMLQSVNPGIGMPLSLEETRAERPKINLKSQSSLDVLAVSSRQSQLPAVKNRNKSRQKMQEDFTVQNLQNRKSSTVFRGKIFCFSNSFPEDRRAEIVQWVNQGGGEVVNDLIKQNVHFTIECHGGVTACVDAPHTTYVSSHWIHSCLEYEDKDRMLLRNLCFVLGAKFVEKLTKKVTHLLCKFISGPKYEAACKWGIPSVTCDWIYECVRQKGVVSLDPFYPREVTAHDREAGLCTVSQFPTQAVRMFSTDELSQLTSSSQDPRAMSSEIIGSKNDSNVGNRNDGLRDLSKQSNVYSKRARISEDEGHEGLLAHFSDPVSTKSSSLDNLLKDDREVSHVVPDVAAVIEDILEQTSKIQDLNSPETTGHNKSLFSSDCSVLGQNHTDSHSVIGLSRQWLNRTAKKEDACNPSGDVHVGTYDGFSETQTDSQVVGYEEDLSGMQMLIDKVRTRSSMT